MNCCYQGCSEPICYKSISKQKIPESYRNYYKHNVHICDCSSCRKWRYEDNKRAEGYLCENHHLGSRGFKDVKDFEWYTLSIEKLNNDETNKVKLD